MAMDPDFWHARWHKQEIGFHQPEGNPLLGMHWPALAIASATRVLVPLCGKTPDMAWLAARGHEVLGVELSEQAVRDFFTEQGIAATVSERDGFRIHSGGGVTIWVGDFFAMPSTELAACGALYDRASLIALPPEMRRDFAAKLCAELPGDCRGLLIAVDYDQSEMDGPPFSVPESEVRALFAGRFSVEALSSQDALASNSRFRERGLSAMRENAFRIDRPR